MKLKIPKLGIGNKGELTSLVIVGAIALGVWYFGINASTRKIDLLGTLGVDKILPQSITQTLSAPELPMDAIPVTNNKPQDISPPTNTVNTVPVFLNPSGAYETTVTESYSSLPDSVSVS